MDNCKTGSKGTCCQNVWRRIKEAVMGFKPGPPPDNEPSAFEFLTDNRLLHNPNITRMPTTQREWNTFIQELNKWVKNETGSFDPTFTGFSSGPTAASVWWHRYGQLVYLQFEFTTGTSDATGFTITNLPDNITPRDTQRCLIWELVDGSSTISNVQTVDVKSDGTIAFYSAIPDNAWTASGGKGIARKGNSIMYSLRQPGKH